MSLSSDLALLRLAPPFAALTDEQLRLVAFSGERLGLPAGGLLIEAGQAPPGAFVVLTGLIEVRAAGCRASQPAGPGAMIAQLALLAETDLVVEARATRPSEVMLVRRVVFKRLLEEYPDVAASLHARLSADFLQLGAAVAGVRENFADPNPLRRALSGGTPPPKTSTEGLRMFPDRLTAGYQAFLDGRFSSERARYEMLAERGQRPEIMVVGCVDSRVSPEVIFDAAPGELLVVRNVANLIPAYEADADSQHGTSAALEFGVQALRVRHIVVLGHALCGGVRAYADEQQPLSPGDFIGRWMSQIAPAAERLGPRKGQDFHDFLRRLEFATVDLGLRNLMTFPFVRARVEAGQLALHGALFSVSTGRLLVRDQTTGLFQPVAEAERKRSLLRCS